jgi:site-specific DNA-methyltransferase (adenine-specific)
MTIKLLQGDWRETLRDVDTCDAVICDPPYSRRTHEGYRTNPKTGGAIDEQNGVDYDKFDGDHAWALCKFVFARARRWSVIFGDHNMARYYREYLDQLGWYVFAPVSYVKTDAPPRMIGDGPTCSTEWITVARPRRKLEKRDIGSRPGHYLARSPRDGFTGQKDLSVMRAIVRDYSQPGDLIVDPFCGMGTTAIACRAEGRDCITTEIDGDTYNRAKQRINKPWAAGLPF